jgi:hypothetical protein
VTREEMLQDLAYARTLAEEGRQAPLVGGAYLVLFGVLLTLAYGAHFLALSAEPVTQQFIGFIWMGFGVCAGIGCVLLRGRTKALPGGASVGNRADRVIWQGVAIAILVVVIGTILRSAFLGDFANTDAIMAAGFGLYGVALYATASLSGHSWLSAFAWLAWAISGPLWFYMGQPWAYLIAAAGAILVLLIPGLIMMRREPSAIV